jgi:hypothetical protein
MCGITQDPSEMTKDDEDELYCSDCFMPRDSKREIWQDNIDEY